ncbi:MAG: hypothetical protein ACR9NN_16295 [Nostochopsis sp.]
MVCLVKRGAAAAVVMVGLPFAPVNNVAVEGRYITLDHDVLVSEYVLPEKPPFSKAVVEMTVSFVSFIEYLPGSFCV